MEKIEFEGSQGHTLAARLDKPAGDIKAYAIFAHCFTCGKDLQPANKIAQALNNDGIAVLRFDFTGLGKSGGEFENTNFSSNVQDLLAAADHMRKYFEAPALMIGHSLGGTATIAASTQVPECKAVVTIGSPANTTNITKQFQADVEKIETEGEAEVKLAGRPFKIKKQFLDDIKGHNIEDMVKNLKKAFLVCHSPVDDTVSIDHASKLFVAAKHPKSFLSLDKADHLLFTTGVAEYIARNIAAWASSYLPQKEMKLAEQTTVTSTGEGKFQQIVRTGKHSFLADEPESVGGKDTGPDPYAFLKTALGTCTSMTLQMYADHKKLPLESVSVEVRHNRIHAKDCEDCETKEGMVDQLERIITIKGDRLTDEQRSRLLEIADKCPVHKTLENEVKIRTRAAEPSQAKAA